jgi:hypothetical protein
MDVYDFLITTFNKFVAFFPDALQWLAALLVLIGLVGLLGILIRQHFLFIILALLLLPFLIPIVGGIVKDIYAFLRYLLTYIQGIFFGS